MAAAQEKKRCLYEILAVNRDCSPEEIRSAYKRLALQLHPDKLPAASSESTAAFQDLLHAYEVLSDPKERAFYDSRVLYSKSHPSSSSSSSSYSFSDLDLFSFFSKSAFSSYADSGKGFYKVYADLFAKIHSQELAFADVVIDSPPLIGNLDSPYAQVTAFYGFWFKFSTVVDFAWVDEYDSCAGANRKARRVMEEENVKKRKKARREYNETVRGLAGFVKKRDKRVLDMQVKRNEEEERRRAEEKERRREEERKKKERALVYEEPDWAKNDGDDDNDDDDESKLVWDEGMGCGRRKERGDVEMYCVVCNKKFKSDMQWRNHERSKKHREKVADLRSAFDDEDEVLKDVGEGNGSCGDNKDGVFEAFENDLSLKDEGDDNVNVNDDDDLHGNNIGRNSKVDVIRDSNGVSEVQNSDFGQLEEVFSLVEEVSEITNGDQVVGKTLNIKKQQVDGKGSVKKETIQPKRSSKGKKQKAASKAPSNSCGTCGENFDSRNKLFSHLSKTGHAMLKSW